jgi:acyl-CoA reductase-like NAD-dependent aldehyde dehydrogenase
VSPAHVDEAVRIANDSDYGLHGAVFTTDPARAMDLSRRIRTGTFSVNNFVYNNRVPFGGVKNSGVGRDTGREGYESFFELKTVNLDARTASLFS